MRGKNERYEADTDTKEGHVFVMDRHTRQEYDSSTGAGAVEKQYGGTCPLNTYDNIFYLDTMGDVYYTEFSRKLRPTKDFYLFYTFVIMYDLIEKEGGNFADFHSLIEKKWPEDRKDADYVVGRTPYLPSWLNSFSIDILLNIAKEAGADMSSNDNSDFMKMAKYVFTDIKNREGLGGDFSFEKDAPHLMKFFGYSSEDYERAIEEHLKNYFSYNTSYMNAKVNGYDIDTMPTDKILITRESLIFLEYFSALYDVYEHSSRERIQYIGTDTKDEKTRFRVLTDSRPATAFGLVDSNFTSKHITSITIAAVDFCYEETIQSRSKIGILMSFHYNSILFASETRNLLTSTFDNMLIYSLAIGGYYTKIFDESGIHLNSGILLDFAQPATEDSLEDKFDFTFRSRNTTLFIRSQKTFEPSTVFLPTTVIVADLANTWFNFNDIVVRKKFTNYNVENNSYYLTHLNFSVDFIRNWTNNFNVSMYFKNINYLNKPDNSFILRNKTYNNLTIETDSVIDVRNSFSMGFRFFYSTKRFNYTIGYNMDLLNSKKGFVNIEMILQF
ncbi:MAG: hypothetical protein LBP39_00920 [Rickettsiales bacterium]|nr:hypothetical protein [Rickettsiales bacterium]